METIIFTFHYVNKKCVVRPAIPVHKYKRNAGRKGETPHR